MRMRVLTTRLRVEIENETRVFLESLDFEIEARVSQKSAKFSVPVEVGSTFYTQLLKNKTSFNM